MDNGNTWKCANWMCKKKAIPMQISVGALWNQIWFWNLIMPPNCFPGKTKPGFFWNDQYSSPCIPHLPETQNINGWGIIMKPTPRSTKCYYHHKTSALWRHQRKLGDIAAISWTLVSELFSLGLSGAAGKTQSNGRGRNTGPKDCSVWPEVQTIDSQRSLSEPTTNPQVLFTVQTGAWTERPC